MQCSMLCLPCEQIMLIRLSQGKGFIDDICPECRLRIQKALESLKTG